MNKEIGEGENTNIFSRFHTKPRSGTGTNAHPNESTNIMKFTLKTVYMQLNKCLRAWIPDRLKKENY